MTVQPFPVSQLVASQRPHRKDAARNYDALIAAAREIFAESGADASLEDIARRAGSASAPSTGTSRPAAISSRACTRTRLNDLCRVARDVAELDPWEALTSWLRRFVDYTVTKRAIRQAMDDESEIFLACRESMYQAGGPLFERAQKAGRARTDINLDDLLRMVAGITATNFLDDAQRDRVLNVALDGVRADG